MIKQTNENMARFTILKKDGWVKIASKDDSINIQNQSNAPMILQVVDTKPTEDIDWGFKSLPVKDKPFLATHDVYARAMHQTLIVVVQKD